MRSHGNILVKLIFLVIFTGLVSSSVYWLWQRQPKPEIHSTSDSNLQTATSSASPEGEKTAEPINIENPKNHSVLSKSPATISAKTDPNSYIVIFSDSASSISKSDQEGKFTVDIALANKLNLIDIEVLAGDLKPKHNKILTYYLEKGSEKSLVYTGDVKSVFDTVITITTDEGEIGVRTNQNTKIEIPPSPDDSGEEGIKGIRIADFALVIGERNKDIITASSVQIFRNSKPQIEKDFKIIKTLANSKRSFFNAKDQDGQILEFSLNNASEISNDGNEAKESDIIKDKNAIVIFYKQNDKNIVDFIYLLP